MNPTQPSAKITITKNGPYLVTGGVPLLELRIVPHGESYVYAPGRPLPQAAQYALCRCGRSKNMPFCDASHIAGVFIDSAEHARRARLAKKPADEA